MEITFLLTLTPTKSTLSDLSDGDIAAADEPVTNGFALLGVSPVVVRALNAQGITIPTPIQALTIPDTLEGRDICGKACTGSGKTLAFGLPLLERLPAARSRRPAALVLVPTRELAQQVATALRPLAATLDRKVGVVFGGASLILQAQQLRQGVDLLVATPGRLIDLLERGDASLADVSTVVLDEADQMADLGFLPQVRRILDGIGRGHQTLLFSATLDGDVDQLVRRYQHEPAFHEAIATEEETASAEHRFIGVEFRERTSVTAAITAGPERVLVFVRTQRGADRLVDQLAREGVAAVELHGGLSQPQRERALRAFSTGRVTVLVATNVAARGIHVDNIDIVLHYDLPADAKTYVHRSGRTARAGATGMVVTLVLADQLREVGALQQAAGIWEPVVAMRPSDPRLLNLAGWSPSNEERTADFVPSPAHSARQAPERGSARRFVRATPEHRAAVTVRYDPHRRPRPADVPGRAS